MTHRTKWLLAGLLYLALWPTLAPAQQGAWERYMRAAATAYQQGNYPEAVAQTEAALKIAEGFGLENNRLATTLNNLAVFYHAQGKYADAEPLKTFNSNVGFQGVR